MPRAGSTLLQRMLGAHAEVFTHPEPHLISPIAHLGVYGNVDKAPYDHINAAEAMKAFIEELPNGEQDYLDALRAYSDTLYGRMLSTSNASYFLDKTPANALVLPFLQRLYPEAKYVRDPDVRWIQINRLVAKMPTLAAFAYRYHRGLPIVYPENELSYTANFLNMLFRIGVKEYKPNPVLERALDVLFILHADHEQNCSTSTVRLAGSSLANPFAAISAGIGALWGPAHGGANEKVIRMLEEIALPGSASALPPDSP